MVFYAASVALVYVGSRDCKAWIGQKSGGKMGWRLRKIDSTVQWQEKKKVQNLYLEVKDGSKRT